MDDFSTVKTLFVPLVKNQTCCMEVYDLLAEIHQLESDFEAARVVLQDAVQLSPKSVRRQQPLSTVSQQLGDTLSAANVYQKVVRLSQNSFYENPIKTINLAIAQLDHAANCDDKAEKVQFARKARATVERAENTEANVETKLARKIFSYRLAVYEENDNATELLADIDEYIDKLLAEDSALCIDSFIAVAKLHQELHNGKRSRALFKEALAQDPDNRLLAYQIDRQCDEAVSAKGKQAIAEINRLGIQLYEEGDLDKAIAIYNNALKRYPNHVGLNLNFVQTTLRKLEDLEVPEETTLYSCQERLEKLDWITPDSKQFKRYSTLHEHIDRLNL